MDRPIDSPVRTVEVVGILNVTPDSFSDGGQHATLSGAIERGFEMIAEGADWVDVGGESTRPGSQGVSVEEELRRVLPVVEALVKEGVAVSIDTSKTEVAKRALQAGARVVNDVGALRADGMIEAVAEAGAGAVLMHMQGTPRTMQDAPQYGNVVEDVRAFLEERLACVRAAGISPIWLDPGIGFGKTLQQNLVLLRELERFRAPGVGVYVGASRKRFIGQINDVTDANARLAGSLGAAAAAVAAGADVIRVHDVAETRRMLNVYLAVAGAPNPSLGAHA
ncbi:MAG: dihydropteroate synthase [Myxococcota bacterium]|nr:dihydropteroate synthase [Myxococcota bacterium]